MKDPYVVYIFCTSLILAFGLTILGVIIPMIEVESMRICVENNMQWIDGNCIREVK
jgi:hypothetical protein